MGNTVSIDSFSRDNSNLIVNDIGTFYLLTAVLKLTGYKEKISIIPSTEVKAIPLMCNIMMGWGLKFAVILFGNEEERKMEDFLHQKIFRTDEHGSELILKMDSQFQNAEDLLSTLDFKNHVLDTREGITIANSAYMKEKYLPRNFLLSRFLSSVKSGAITLKNLDEETVENFRAFTALVKGLK